MRKPSLPRPRTTRHDGSSRNALEKKLRWLAEFFSSVRPSLPVRRASEPPSCGSDGFPAIQERPCMSARRHRYRPLVHDREAAAPQGECTDRPGTPRRAHQDRICTHTDRRCILRRDTPCQHRTRCSHTDRERTAGRGRCNHCCTKPLRTGRRRIPRRDSVVPRGNARRHSYERTRHRGRTPPDRRCDRDMGRVRTDHPGRSVQARDSQVRNSCFPRIVACPTKPDRHTLPST